MKRKDKFPPLSAVGLAYQLKQVLDPVTVRCRDEGYEIVITADGKGDVRMDGRLIEGGSGGC